MYFLNICPKSTNTLEEQDVSLPVTVKNVKEMRRLMPQFMLEVKAMARPLIPPGKISLSSSQGTGRKGRRGREQQNYKKAIETEGPALVCPARCVVGEQGHVLFPYLQPSETALRRSTGSLTIVPRHWARDLQCWYGIQA